MADATETPFVTGMVTSPYSAPREVGYFGGWGAKSDGTIDDLAALVIRQTGSETADIELATSTTGTGRETRLTVTSAGNVGIGTTGPAAKLHVAGGAMAVDADQKVSLKGAASSNDTYVTYSSAEGKAWFYVNGQKVAWFKD